MKQFASVQEVDDFVKQANRDSETEISELCQYQNITRSYYIGQQWISQRGYGSKSIEARLDRRRANYNAEQGPIRAVINRVTRNIIGIYNRTQPDSLAVDAEYSAYNTDSDTKIAAYACEAFTNQLIDDSGMLPAAEWANFERTICGVHGIGIAIEDMGGDRRLRCYPFDASQIALDPGIASADFMDHEYVIYNEVCTIHQMKRMFGEEWVAANLNVDKLPKLGTLKPMEIAFNQLSGGQLYARYAQHSQTPAAKVSWLYCKDDRGRFGKMYISVDAGTGKPLVVNMDDPVSPYGGCGLPFVMLRGHMRPQTRLPISDVGMMIGDQDRLNLLGTLFLMQAYDYTAGEQIFMDRKAFGKDKSDMDKIIRRMNQRVVALDSTTNAMKPYIHAKPEPSQAVDMLMRRAEGDVRTQGFRSEAADGSTKSHVPTTVWEQTEELSSLPIDTRVTNDGKQYERLASVLLGTAIKMVQEDSSYMARLAVRSGLSEYELGTLASINPFDLPVTLKLHNKALRRRSTVQRRRDLVDAIQLQAIGPEELRHVLAAELDMPLSEGDKKAQKFASIAAVRTRDGETYVPLTLGQYSQYVIRAMQHLLMDDRTSMIDGASARLEQAIVDQRMHDVEQLAMEQQMLGQATGGGAEQVQPDPMQSMTIEDMLQGANLQPQTYA